MPRKWNQKSHRYTVDVPEPLVPLLLARRNSVPYPSVSKYLFALVVYDMLLRKPHRFTPWLMRQTDAKQRLFFDELIENFASMKSPGSWMETRIREEAAAMIERGEADDLLLARAEKLRALADFARETNTNGK